MNGRSYLFLTPIAGSGATGPGGMMRASYSLNGPTVQTRADAFGPLLVNVQMHVAVVVDERNTTMSLYMDGIATGLPTPLYTSLSLISSVNCWLGRSNFSTDPELNGILHEFRIYNAALNENVIRASYMAGPDATF
jgi:hypothetical protein